MIYSVTTSTSMETIKNTLPKKAEEAGFGLMHTYAFKEILYTKGFPIEREVTLFEICNPKAAQEALNCLPKISVYLPCRISLYEDQGKTILSTIEFERSLSDIKADESLKANMHSIYKNLKSIMHSWD